MIEYIRRDEAIAAFDDSRVDKYYGDVDPGSVIRVIEQIHAADVQPAIKREDLLAALSDYFSVGDSYTYELTRVKEAFSVGTMSLDDFEEWGEEKIFDLCEYLMCKLFCPDHRAEMLEGGAYSGGEYADNQTLAPA